MGINAGHNVAHTMCSTRTSSQSMRRRSCRFVSAVVSFLIVSLPVSASSTFNNSDNTIITKAENLKKTSQLWSGQNGASFLNTIPAATFPTQHVEDTLKFATVPPDSVLVLDAVIVPVADDVIPLIYHRDIHAVVDSAYVSVPNETKHDIFALRSNLLFDAVTALNFELEIPLGSRMSIVWQDIFPWWEKGYKYCLEYWAMGPEVRYYFRKWDSDTKFRGFYTGIYGLTGKYDFQYDFKLCYQGEFWSTGVSFGYSKAVGKKQRVIMDFSMSLGYVQSGYRHYKPAFDYSELIKDNYNTGRINYMGPTQVKIGLTIPVQFTRKAKEVSYE